MTLNAFHWRSQPSVSGLGKPEPKPMSPQLAYYHRKYALGIHPRQIRYEGKEVVDQRFKKNRKNENT